jgi:hypothetical protein
MKGCKHRTARQSSRRKHADAAPRRMRAEGPGVDHPLGLGSGGAGVADGLGWFAEHGESEGGGSGVAAAYGEELDRL